MNHRERATGRSHFDVQKIAAKPRRPQFIFKFQRVETDLLQNLVNMVKICSILTIDEIGLLAVRSIYGRDRDRFLGKYIRDIFSIQSSKLA